MDMVNLDVSFQAAWDDDYLYMLIRVTDDVIVIDGSDANYEHDDSVEFYLDGDNSRDKGTAWNVPGYDFINDRQLKIKADNSTPMIGGLYDPQENGTVIIEQDVILDRTFVETDVGYNIELRMNFSGIFRDFFADGSMVQTPAEDVYFGFDIKVADDDDGGDRDITHGWAADSNNSYADPQIFGTMVLTAGAAPKFELTPGEYKWDGLTSWTYGLTGDIGQSLMLGYIYVGQHPSAIYSYKLGWLLSPTGSADGNLYFYRYSTGSWIWITEAYGGFYWDYGISDWGSAL